MKRAAVIVLLFLCLAGPALAAVTTIKVVDDPAGLPQPLPRIALKGDILVSGGRYTAVIAATPRALWSSINYGHPDVAGYVAAFLPAGASARPDIQFGYASVRLGKKALFVSTSSVRVEGGAAVVVRSSCSGPDGLRLDILVRYTFALDAGRLDVSAEVRNAGPSEVKGLSFGLGAGPRQSYNFSPHNAKAFPTLNFRVYQRPDHALAWYNPNPVETSDKPLPGILRPEQTYKVAYKLLAGAELSGLLDRLYRLVRVPTVLARLELKGAEGPAEVIVREPATGAVFFRTFLDKPAPLAFPLPAGTYALRANIFPAVVDKTVQAVGGPKANSWTLESPALGRVRVSLADRKGRPVPGKVTFIGLAPTPSPYFTPVDPIESGRSWESLYNTVYPPKDGLGVDLPAGTYLATSSRGPEYSRETAVVEVLAGDNRPLAFTIDRVLETPGLVSLDTHMHTQFSDGSVLVARRLQSAAAEGVDIAFSADHNTVTDYLPELERLGLTGDLAVIPAVEVTARTGSIHFNSLPVAVRPGEPGHGAISVRDETPAKLFALARAKDPGALIQLNHPRSGTLGYFNNYDLDPEKAAFANALFDLDFEVMEAMNGAKFEESNRKAVEDWFHLLNRGYPIRVVGSSDAHGIDGGETGYSRTYVLYDGPWPAKPDQAALVAALKKGRAFVSNGPIVTVRAARGATFGDTVKASRGRVDLDITVTGAPWLDVSEVRLVVNGERRPPLAMKGAGRGSVKFRDSVRVEFPRDGWVAVEVVGKTSLFPMLQQRSGDGRPEEAALPYALTNPILVDADGDGRSDPVWPEKVIIK
jgi:hypothetical protein